MTNSEIAAPHYAGFWRRMVASILDIVILSIPGSIFIFFLSHNIVHNLVHNIFYNKLGFIVSWAYFTIMESSSYQATLGKMALRLKVTDKNGCRISFAQSNKRYFSKIFCASAITFCFVLALFNCVPVIESILITGALPLLLNERYPPFLFYGYYILVSYIFVIPYMASVAFTAKKQALHDFMAETLVVKS